MKWLVVVAMVAMVASKMWMTCEGGRVGWPCDVGDIGKTVCDEHHSREEWVTCMRYEDAPPRAGPVLIRRGINWIPCWAHYDGDTNWSRQVARRRHCTCRVGQDPPPSSRDGCFSPDGATCDWWENCLEVAHPCGSEGFALGFAKKFCNFYGARLSYFSAQGQRWINAVRKCLQVKSSGVVRKPWEAVTCDQIKDQALASHVPCYLHPDPGAPSFCDLSVADKAQVFWTIKGGYIQSFVTATRHTAALLARCAIGG